LFGAIAKLGATVATYPLLVVKVSVLEVWMGLHYQFHWSLINSVQSLSREQKLLKDSLSDSRFIKCEPENCGRFMSKQLNHFQTVEWSSQLYISEECGALYPWFITYRCMWAVICSMIVLHSSSFNWRWGHATNKFAFLGSHDFKLSKRLAKTSRHSILVSENNGLTDFVVLMRLVMPNIQQQTPHISFHQSSWS
jgi:hypothetical protein